MKTKLIFFFIFLSILGCKKLAQKVENYDLFGLDQASEAIDKQQEKIKAAKEYQEKYSSTQQETHIETNILK